MNTNYLPNQLTDWLHFLATIHPREIDLGLDRIKIVAERLQLLNISIPVITISGTNGKGSCVATLESIYKSSGYKVGVFSSPFLLSFNEQIRINQQEVADDTLCAAFSDIYLACRDISLSTFEYTTLAALLIFKQKNLDVIILEVGMGGKRDAVNIIDPTLTVITNVALDHQQWLGTSREEIGEEKSGIFRKNISAVIGEVNSPKSLIVTANSLQVTLYRQSIDFFYEENDESFTWIFKNKKINELPLPKLALTNIANALMAIELLQNLLPVTTENLKNGLKNIKLNGRFQIKYKPVIQIFDVAHNPAGVNFLKDNVNKFLQNNKIKTIRAVFSMLKDKDIKNCILPFLDVVNEWYIAPVKDKRAANLKQLGNAFSKLHVEKFYEFDSIQEAYITALKNSNDQNDAIIIYGSFRTVAEV